MKKIRTFLLATCCGVAMTFTQSTQAQSSAELAAESAAKCKETAATTPTQELIKEKVNAAKVLIESEGTASYSKFRGKESKFLFAGTYIWIHDINGVMQMHPIKPKMEGKKLIGLKDNTGKRFFVTMNNLVKAKGEGWVDYMWPKPGEKARSRKVSFVKGAMVEGKQVVIGCGVYDMPDEEIDKLVK